MHSDLRANARLGLLGATGFWVLLKNLLLGFFDLAIFNIVDDIQLN